jgi:hypothetical protein
VRTVVFFILGVLLGWGYCEEFNKPANGATLWWLSYHMIGYEHVLYWGPFDTFKQCMSERVNLPDVMVFLECRQ